MARDGRGFALGLVGAVALALGIAPSASAFEGFGSPFTHPVGDLPVHVAAGDLNADGRDDLVVPNFSTGDVSVLLATPGGFEPAVSYPTEDGAFAAAIGDLNQDGRPDIAVAAVNEGVSVLLAKGGGAFEPAVDYLEYPTGDALVSVAIGDLNGDGRADLAATDTFQNCVFVLHGDGGGAFEEAGCLNVGQRPERLAVGDLNGDGRDDLAVATEAAVEVLHARPGGGFDAPSAYPAGKYPFDVAIGDLNGDARPDLAVANFESTPDGVPGYMSVLLAKEHGGYQPPVDYRVGSRPEGVAIGDVNRDGRLDVVVANYATGAGGGLSVLLGAPGGALTPETRYAAGSWSRAVAIGDFNGDGWPDLAAPNDTPNTVSVVYSRGPVIRLSVDALVFAPQTVGTVGAEQTVTVTNAGSGPLNVSSVTVVGADAEAFEASGEGCTASTIAPAATCDIQVRFKPGKPGLAQAALQVASDAPNSPSVVPLSGLGRPQLPHVPPVIELPPITLPDLGGGSASIKCQHRAAGPGKAKVDCSVTARAADGDRRVSVRLTRAERTYVSRQRVLRAGRKRVSLTLGRAVKRSRYVLRVELRDGDGRRTVAKRRVDLRR